MVRKIKQTLIFYEQDIKNVSYQLRRRIISLFANDANIVLNDAFVVDNIHIFATLTTKYAQYLNLPQENQPRDELLQQKELKVMPKLDKLKTRYMFFNQHILAEFVLYASNLRNNDDYFNLLRYINSLFTSGEVRYIDAGTDSNVLKLCFEYEAQVALFISFNLLHDQLTDAIERVREIVRNRGKKVYFTFT